MKDDINNLETPQWVWAIEVVRENTFGGPEWQLLSGWVESLDQLKCDIDMHIRIWRNTNPIKKYRFVRYSLSDHSDETEVE